MLSTQTAAANRIVGPIRPFHKSLGPSPTQEPPSQVPFAPPDVPRFRGLARPYGDRRRAASEVSSACDAGPVSGSASSAFPIKGPPSSFATGDSGSGSSPRRRDRAESILRSSFPRIERRSSKDLAGVVIMAPLKGKNAGPKRPRASRPDLQVSARAHNDFRVRSTSHTPRRQWHDLRRLLHACV